MTDTKRGSPSVMTARCPICRKPTDAQFRPFCSRRCADVDLARWLNGAYAIAGGGDDHDEDGEGPAAVTPARTDDEPR